MDTSDAIRVSYRGENDFEILVEPDLAKEAKLEGKDHDIQRMLFVQDVFKDADSGERASADDLQEEFDTRQVMEAAGKIFEEGDMQLTTEQKRKMREDKYRQVVDMIARRAQDPKTGNPHPPNRVENALEEAGFNADPMEEVEDQFDEAIDMIKPIIPVSLDEKNVAIKIPNDKAGKAYDMIQKKADVKEEQWGNEYFYAKVKLPAGILTELMEDIQEATGGKAEMSEEF